MDSNENGTKDVGETIMSHEALPSDLVDENSHDSIELRELRRTISIQKMLGEGSMDENEIENAKSISEQLLVEMEYPRYIKGTLQERVARQILANCLIVHPNIKSFQAIVHNIDWDIPDAKGLVARLKTRTLTDEDKSAIIENLYVNADQHNFELHALIIDMPDIMPCSDNDVFRLMGTTKLRAASQQTRVPDEVVASNIYDMYLLIGYGWEMDKLCNLCFC